MSDEYFQKLVNFSHCPDLPEDEVNRADVEAVLQDGYVVMENLIPMEEIENLRDEIARMTGDSPKLGRHIFEGRDTVRLYSLLNKSVFLLLFDFPE